MNKIKLKDIAIIGTGQSAPKYDSDFSVNGYPFIRAGHLNDLLTGLEEKELPCVDENIARKYRLMLYPSNTIIFAKSGMSVNKERIYKLKSPCYIVSHLATLIPQKNVIPDYLRFALNSISLIKLVNDPAYPSIKISDVEKLEIPYYTQDTQIRIAKVLTWAEELIEERKNTINLLNELLRSKYLEMFGDPVSNNKNWEKSPISKHSSSIVPGRDKPKSFTGQIPWVTTSDLDNLGFVEASIDNIGLTVSEITEVKAKIIPRNSVILTCVGDLGKVSINKKEIVVNQQLHVYQCDENINNIFTMYTLSFQKKYMYRMATTTTVPYMNKTACNSIPIIVPPLTLQVQFASIVEEVESVKKDYKQSLSELENLSSSLSQRAFKGELNLSHLDITEELKTHEEIIQQNEKQEKSLIQKEKKIKQKTDSNKEVIKELTSSTIHDIQDLPWESAVFNTEKIANLLKEKYTGFHFSFEMAFSYLSKHINNIQSHYFYSEELFGNPILKSRDNFKDFFESALQKENRFIQLEQHFYDSEKENFNLQLTEDDYYMWANYNLSEDPTSRSGIYFNIK